MTTKKQHNPRRHVFASTVANENQNPVQSEKVIRVPYHSLSISLIFSERIRQRNLPRQTSNDSNKQQQQQRQRPCLLNPLRVSFPLLLNLISNHSISSNDLHDMSDSILIN